MQQEVLKKPKEVVKEQQRQKLREKTREKPFWTPEIIKQYGSIKSTYCARNISQNPLHLDYRLLTEEELFNKNMSIMEKYQAYR